MTCINHTPKPLRKHAVGATWRGLQLVLKDNDGVAIPLTGASITMHVREKKDSAMPALVFSTADNTILVSTETIGKIFIVGRKINVRANNYHLDIKLVMPNGDVIYFFPNTWEIYQTVTR